MRNKAFRRTFYLGLSLIIVFVGVALLIGVNIYNSPPTPKKDNIDNVTVEEYKPEIIGTPKITPFDSLKSKDTPIVIETIKPKKVKVEPEILDKESDTIIVSDTIK